jgi:hypothetical protein
MGAFGILASAPREDTPKKDMVGFSSPIDEGRFGRKRCQVLTCRQRHGLVFQSRFAPVNHQPLLRSEPYLEVPDSTSAIVVPAGIPAPALLWAKVSTAWFTAALTDSREISPRENSWPGSQHQRFAGPKSAQGSFREVTAYFAAAKPNGQKARDYTSV